MLNWLTQKAAPTEVLFISGMGGIGKSALMLQFLNMAQDENVLCIWLDGRVCTETPAGFLESLHASLPNIPDIVSDMSRQRTLLCIDNYDYLHKIEGETTYFTALARCHAYSFTFPPSFPETRYQYPSFGSIKSHFAAQAQWRKCRQDKTCVLVRAIHACRMEARRFPCGMASLHVIASTSPVFGSKTCAQSPMA
jgi:hypothetical protein